MRRIALFVLAAATLCGPALFAQDEDRQDAEGCKDFPLISRFPGSKINGCDHKEFDSYSMPVARDKDNYAVEKAFEGEYWTWDMGTREGLSQLQIYRNFFDAMKSSGWIFDYQDSPGRFTAHKGGYQVDLQSSGTYYYLTVVKPGKMNQEVTADATSMGAEIDKSGHVAVYGINFETGKAAILPESEPVLAEVQKLLESRPDLKLRIEGHTDNTGSQGVNQTLSEKRAAAVAGWLIAHGIDGGRLTSKGFADTKPVADNNTEDGRAKNRRVELVKQ
jgi:outer membrane protein OmpA-like peptidoglycan-associated protein